MKKVFSITVAVLILMVVSACSDHMFISFQNNLSEVRRNLFESSDEEVYVTFMTGLREEDYVLDGVSTNKMEFGVVAFSMLKNENLYLTQPKYRLTVNDKVYEGELARNPYDFTYVADIQRVVENSAVISAQIISDKVNTTLNLNNVSNEWKVSYNEVQELGYKAMKSTIKKHSKTKLLDGEVYIKILYETSKPTAEYFWYVGVVFKDGKNISVILDINTGKVLSTNY